MPIRSISAIKVGNYPAGQFAGGYIYSLQFAQGYAESVNELTIDIVYDKDTNISLPSKNLTNPYRIQIGDLIIPSMFFIEHSKDVTPSENILRCKFVDSSFILDKYYVGLTNRHYKIREGAADYGLTIFCTDCEQNLVPTQGTVRRYIVTNSPNILVNKLLVVGEEEFVEQTCDLPDVKYNFSDLLETMRKIPNLSFEGFTDINNKYKTSYIGTLREVLSNWCSDFGFSFYWDFLRDKLVAIDLRSPVNLSNIENFINQNFNRNSTFPIANYSEEESLAGTYQQDNIDYILKPARSKQREFTDFWSIGYEPVTVSNAFFTFGTDMPDITSCVLAKYNSQARNLYNLQNGRYSKVGFELVYSSINTNVLVNCFKNVWDFYQIGNVGASIKLGYYDEAKEASEIERESLIADGIGRYYGNTSYINWKPPSCNDTSKLSYNGEYFPQPMDRVPFADAGGNPSRPQPVGWWIERNPTYNHQGNLDLTALGPIYINIDGETADQVRDTFLLYNPSDTDPDRYRGLTLIAFKPYLSVSSINNVWNAAEEGWVPAQFEQQVVECQTFCNRDLSYEICDKIGCKKMNTPAHGLTSKNSSAIRATNLLNGSQSYTILPSQQPYVGYAKAEGTFEWTEFSVKKMNTNADFNVEQNVLEYSINLNDITTEEPNQGQIAWANQTQSSLGLDVRQTNPRKKISLKVIGAEYNAISSYLNPRNGLVGLNIYINDQGTFTDLSFENRPPQKPKPEVVMQKVGPQKVRVIK